MARNFESLLVAIVASLLAVAAWAQPGETFRVVGVEKDDVLNIRSQPTATAKMVGKLPSNATGITKAGECKAWCKVRYKNVEGWVDRRFLEPEFVQLPNASPTPPVVTSSDPVGDCNSDDSSRKLSGCLVLTKEVGLPPATLAIAHSRLSDAYLETNKLDEAVASRSKAVELQPGDAGYKMRLSHTFALRADVRLNKNNPAGALADYTDAIRADPTNHEAYAGRSSVYLLKDEYDRAITDLRAALSLQKGEKTVYELVVARLCERRGIQHVLKKELDQAITRFTEAIELDASRDELRRHRASAYTLRNEIEPALNDYTEAIRINPDNVHAYIGRGELHRRRSALSAAIADFDQAVQKQPSNVTALMFRALTREDTRDREGAIADYQAVLKLDGKHQLAKAGVARLRTDTAVSAGDAVLAPPRRKAGDRPKSHAKQECFNFNGQAFCN